LAIEQHSGFLHRGEDRGRLAAAYRAAAVRHPIERSPFRTLFVDITHRCDMACNNCYIPVRDLPDLPAEWLYDILARLPRRTRIRLVGAEPTMRTDLPQIISRVRELGHIPVILSNGLKLGRRSYLRALKAAGLHTVYLSLNGGLRDDLYEAIDGLACAKRKLLALDNALAEQMYVTTGAIIVRGVNELHLREFIPYLRQRGVRDIHLRSVGKMGLHMEGEPLILDEMELLLREALGKDAAGLEATASQGSSRDFKLGALRVQLTQWPDLGSSERGRITPDGFVEPMFESIMNNEFHY
jgi:molybdenum cofactor biosynthesis enzyme MoaA